MSNFTRDFELVIRDTISFDEDAFRFACVTKDDCCCTWHDAAWAMIMEYSEYQPNDLPKNLIDSIANSISVYYTGYYTKNKIN